MNAVRIGRKVPTIAEIVLEVKADQADKADAWKLLTDYTIRPPNQSWNGPNAHQQTAALLLKDVILPLIDWGD